MLEALAISLLLMLDYFTYTHGVSVVIWNLKQKNTSLIDKNNKTLTPSRSRN